MATKPAICVLTYNVMVSLRCPLLERTLASIEKGFPGCSLHLLDNGSHDGTEEYVLDETSERWESCVVQTSIHSPGAGRNRLGDLVPLEEVPWAVMSDDDMEWSADSEFVLDHFWKVAPADIVLVSCLIEPEYPWSQIHETVDCGGVKAVVRDSVPAAAWSFRGRDWRRIGPLKTLMDDEGEDYEACRRMQSLGLRVAAIDLAKHIGEGYSQLGNDEARSPGVGRPWALSGEGGEKKVK